MLNPRANKRNGDVSGVKPPTGGKVSQRRKKGRERRGTLVQQRHAVRRSTHVPEPHGFYRICILAAWGLPIGRPEIDSDLTNVAARESKLECSTKWQPVSSARPQRGSAVGKVPFCRSLQTRTILPLGRGRDRGSLGTRKRSHNTLPPRGRVDQFGLNQALESRATSEQARMRIPCIDALSL